MNVLVLGATGGTGRLLVQQALDQGHRVTAFARDPSKVSVTHANLRAVRGDVLVPDTVEAAVVGQEVVLSALGVRMPVRTVVAIVLLCQIIIRVIAFSRPAALFIEFGILAIMVLSRRNVCRVGASVGNWLRPSRIARSDVAAFMLRAITEDEYLRKTPGLAY